MLKLFWQKYEKGRVYANLCEIFFWLGETKKPVRPPNDDANLVGIILY